MKFCKLLCYKYNDFSCMTMIAEEIRKICRGYVYG